MYSNVLRVGKYLKIVDIFNIVDRNINGVFFLKSSLEIVKVVEYVMSNVEVECLNNGILCS